MTLCGGAVLNGAGPLTDMLDGQFKGLENDLVSLTEAMPADKFNFVPSSGEFKGVRSFATQAKHIATLNYQVAAAILREKPPVNIGTTDNGPDALKTKVEVVNYLKGSIAYAHKAIVTVNEKNQFEPVAMEGSPMARVAAANMLTWHGFDHYGQMVVYLRLNGIIPPASRPRP